MSTIEKAAAKLAARGKSSLAGKISGDGAAGTPRLPDPTLNVLSKSQGFVDTSTHHCEIDVTALARQGFLTPGEGRSQLAQEMRRIKRPLLLNIQKLQRIEPSAPPANLVMVTSSFPGEGKTFVAINLAISMSAELDRRVLLIDTDVSKGGLTEQLGIASHRGISDLLYETGYLAEDGVLTSNIERLSILPAGGNTDQLNELFASDLMGKITRELASNDPDRVVIFDSPPLLATTEAAVLARLMGQVVLVVEANKTPQEAVSQALGELQGCPNVSTILNKTSPRHGGIYGYGYARGNRLAGAENEQVDGA